MHPGLGGLGCAGGGSPPLRRVGVHDTIHKANGCIRTGVDLGRREGELGAAAEASAHVLLSRAAPLRRFLVHIS